MIENGMTIYHEGDEAYSVELLDFEADHLSDLARILKDVPREQHAVFTPAELEARRAQHEEYLRQAGDFGAQVRRLAALDARDLAMVVALVDLMEFGDANHEGANWALGFIKDIAHDIQVAGPAALLEQDPRSALASLASCLFEYWDWIRTGRKMAERHPSLFPTPQLEAAKPPTKRHSVRKAKRKAA